MDSPLINANRILLTNSFEVLDNITTEVLDNLVKTIEFSQKRLIARTVLKEFQVLSCCTFEIGP